MKLTDSSGEALDGRVPKENGARPVGSQILVELLTPQEIIGTSLHINEDAEVGGAPQGYVLKVGPMVDEKYGLAEGSRVILSGKFTPLPEIDSKRPWALVEPHTIKAVLEE